MFNYKLFKIYIHFQNIPINYGVQCLTMNSLKIFIHFQNIPINYGVQCLTMNS